MELDRHLTKVGERYAVSFEGTEMKGHQPYEASLMTDLTPRIDRYLQVWRPALLKDRTSKRLWISDHGTDMKGISIYFRVRMHTKEEFGVALSLHDFRSGPTTSLAIEDPEHVGAASPILGHRDERTRKRNYNQARMIESARQFQDAIASLRRNADLH